MMKKILSLVFCTYSFCISAQEIAPINKSNTSVSLNYGLNINYSTELQSRSIGGDWGLVVDHQIREKRYGFSAGINYSLINIGPETGFNNPRFALEFGMLESAFGVFLAPFEEVRGLRFKLGYTQALIVNHEDFYYGKFNISILTVGIEYAIPTRSNLALAVGMNYKFYTIDKNEFGYNITNVFYSKIGLKN